MAKVKPIAESFGGKYIVRSENVAALSDTWKPDRIIIIRFPSKEQIDKWLSAPEYKEIAGLRIASVDSEAIIVEENENIFAEALALVHINKAISKLLQDDGCIGAAPK